MTQNEHIFCWHHGDLARLNTLLDQGFIDCPHVNFLTKHGLVPEHLIRVSVKVRNEARGDVVAFLELISPRPFLLNRPLHKDYPFGVRVEVLQRGNLCSCTQYPYAKPPPMNPSHWVDQPEPRCQTT